MWFLLTIMLLTSKLIRGEIKMTKIGDVEFEILKKYNIKVNETMPINDVLEEISVKMLEIGFKENDEINEKGIELERLYDRIFYNNKED